LPAVALALLLVANEAHAADDVTTLETQLGRETTELSTADCASACKALASIRRAADRICDLEPGPRCNAARDKSEAATKRVREACPECALAAMPAPEPRKEERAYVNDASAKGSPAAAPPAESERGGCRSCATTSQAPTSGDLWLFGLVAALITRRLSRRIPRRKK